MKKIFVELWRDSPTCFCAVVTHSPGSGGGFPWALVAVSSAGFTASIARAQKYLGTTRWIWPVRKSQGLLTKSELLSRVDVTCTETNFEYFETNYNPCLQCLGTGNIFLQILFWFRCRFQAKLSSESVLPQLWLSRSHRLNLRDDKTKVHLFP